ncbi:hypothetical protein M8C21_010021, partial [Ambrosia artemisiifolia]
RGDGDEEVETKSTSVLRHYPNGATETSVKNTITQKDKELIYGFGEVPIKIRMVSMLPYRLTYLRVVEKRKKKYQSYTHRWPDRRNGFEKMGLKNYEEKKDQAWGHSNCVDEKNSFGYMVYDLAHMVLTVLRIYNPAALEQ